MPKPKLMTVDTDQITRWDSYAISLNKDGISNILLSFFMDDDSSMAHAEMSIDAAADLANGILEAIATVKCREGNMQ